MNRNLNRTTRFAICTAVALMLLFTMSAWAQNQHGQTFQNGSGNGGNFAGAIFTTTQSGTTVNANLYHDKTAVYLNGGPQGNNGPSLRLGTYYFQITDPSGAQLLSADDIHCREVQVTTVNGTNRVTGRVVDPLCPAPALPHINGATTANGSTGVQVCPAASRGAASTAAPLGDVLNNGVDYDANNWCDTTSNDGGEYKAWLTPVAAYGEVCGSNKAFGFCPDDSKTDNFKIRPLTCEETNTCDPNKPAIVWPLGGYKFYDANTDGIWEAGEPIIDGWQTRVVKSCQEDQSVIARIYPAATFPINDSDLTTPFTGKPYGRQFQYTAAGTYETEALQDLNNPLTFNADGFYQYQNLNAGGHYSVCEVIPKGAASLLSGSSSDNGLPKWIATTNPESDNHWSPDNSANFGNVCIGAGGGLTLGFWSNTNGEGIMAGGAKVPTSCYKPADGNAAMHNALVWLASNATNLVDANGNFIAAQLSAPYSANADPYCFFRSWLLGANAQNSAYMLSAQSAAMWLNIYFNKVDPDALVYAPGTRSANTAGFTNIWELVYEANDSLGKNPYVVAGSVLNGNVDLKTYQNLVKDALDNANNNLNWVQNSPSQCAIAYGDEGTTLGIQPQNNSCIPSDDLSGTTSTYQLVPQNPTAPTVDCATHPLIHYVCSLPGANSSDPACSQP